MGQVKQLGPGEEKIFSLNLTFCGRSYLLMEEEEARKFLGPLAEHPELDFRIKNTGAHLCPVFVRPEDWKKIQQEKIAAVKKKFLQSLPRLAVVGLLTGIFVGAAFTLAAAFVSKVFGWNSTNYAFAFGSVSIGVLLVFRS